MIESEGVAPFTKDIQVQSVIYPNILMKLDFLKEAYGPGEVVMAEFTLVDLDGKPMANKGFQFQCNLSGEKIFCSRKAKPTKKEWQI